MSNQNWSWTNPKRHYRSWACMELKRQARSFDEEPPASKFQKRTLFEMIKKICSEISRSHLWRCKIPVYEKDSSNRWNSLYFLKGLENYDKKCRHWNHQGQDMTFHTVFKWYILRKRFRFHIRSVVICSNNKYPSLISNLEWTLNVVAKVI